MSKKMLLNYSALAISLFCLYPATAAETIHTQSSQQMSSARTSIEAPRQFVLEQPGKPDMVDKQLRWQDHTPLQSTGFWVEKGETVVVDIDYQGTSLIPAPEFFVTTPDDRTNRYKHAFKKTLKKGQNIITSEKSGILYIAAYNDPIAGDIKVNIRSGAKPFARYLLGLRILVKMNSDSGGT
ncbi:M60 family peptidase N-terminal accessory domain-containing protein [Serratia proteamaculans]|nr:M60 family peptidase N-terminal accessory domain-containing protein [Serratia proteamaculans]